MSAATEHTRTRVCAGCRQPVPQDEAVRWFIGPDGALWPDWTHRSARLGGRGATTHAHPSCIEQAHLRGGIKRALRGNYPKISTEDLLDRVIERGEAVFFDRLGLALRAGALYVGSIAVREGFKTSTPALLLLAEDAGASGRERFGRNADRKGCPVVNVTSGAALGRALGREFVGAALVKESAFGRTLVAWSRGLCWLGAPSVVRCSDGPDAANTEVESGLVHG